VVYSIYRLLEESRRPRKQSHSSGSHGPRRKTNSVARNLRKIQRAKKPDRGVFLSRMTPELLDPVLFRCSGSSKAEDSAVLAPLLQRRSFTACAWPSKGEQLERRQQSVAMPSGIGKPSIWLEKRTSTSVSISYAEQTNNESFWTPPHFKTLTIHAPLRYKKHLRLQEARRLMYQRNGSLLRRYHVAAGIAPIVPFAQVVRLARHAHKR